LKSLSSILEIILSPRAKNSRPHETLDLLSFDPPKNGSVIGNYLVNYEVPARGGVKYKSSFAVYIYEADGKGIYLVKEPYLEPALRSIVSRAIESLSSWLAPSPIMEMDPIGYVFAQLKLESPQGKKLSEEDLLSVTHFLTREIVGYSLLDPLVRDPEIEDISCEGPSRSVKVWHRRFNSQGWLETNIYLSQEKLDAIVTRLVHRSGRSISTVSPMIDTVLPEGYRLAATWGREVTSLGSSFSIRKQKVEPPSLSELIKGGTLDSKVGAYLWMLLELKGFLVVAGVTASGKTTLLNSLAALLNPSWKILSIEDTREINLPQSGWKPLHTRFTSSQSSNITLFDLVKHSLRERPDFVILGEARGQEVQALFQSAAAGSGCATTFHAPNLESMVARLTGPPLSVSRSLLSLIDAIVFMVKSPDSGKRRIIDVFEMADTPFHLFRSDGAISEGTPEESRKLEKRGIGFGYSSRRMKYELQRRVEFLDLITSKGIARYAEISKELRRFYLSSSFTL